MGITIAEYKCIKCLGKGSPCKIFAGSKKNDDGNDVFYCEHINGNAPFKLMKISEV